MDMPRVASCDLKECAYNDDGRCHALAITVGHQSHPMCDTFFAASRHGGDPGATGRVGACKMDTCRYNWSYECAASNIQVGRHEGSCPDCQTYQPAA